MITSAPWHTRYHIVTTVIHNYDTSIYPLDYHPLEYRTIQFQFHILEVVSRYREPQFQVGEKDSVLWNVNLSNDS